MDGCRRRRKGGLIKPDLCHGAFMAVGGGRGTGIGGNGWEEALSAVSARL